MAALSSMVNPLNTTAGKVLSKTISFFFIIHNGSLVSMEFHDFRNLYI